MAQVKVLGTPYFFFLNVSAFEMFIWKLLWTIVMTIVLKLQVWRPQSTMKTPHKIPQYTTTKFHEILAYIIESY